MSDNPNGFAITAIALIVVTLGLMPKVEVSYSGDYFLKSTTWFGRLQKVERCRIYDSGFGNPDEYYCEEIIPPPPARVEL